MNIREKIFCGALMVAVALMGTNSAAVAQSSTKLDTIECHIVGFNVGVKVPSAKYSFATAPDGSTDRRATMASLYPGAYMDYGINGLYKYRGNWLVSVDGNIWFGNNNLLYRKERMGSVYTHDSIVIGQGGTDANVSCYNRGFSVQGGFGRVFPVAPGKNPNSGIVARISGGYMLQQTIFMVSNENAPQVQGDYALLYDHQRQGAILTESLDFWFMSNNANLLNLYVSFDVSQCWSRSTRDYVIDNYLGLHGKDNNRYFDLIYSIKLCWMFPLKGKESSEYYYY
ncbi:MAG: hypothetical protein J5641_03380 [Bacteroidales bacterium]|nr:hypothetical protein [Bacteroidales bacterium]